MANLAVEKVQDGQTTPPTLFERMAAIAGSVRQRAFELFESRGGGDGGSLDDWLQAEREIVEPLEAKLTEMNGKFQVKLAIPGFALKDIRVTAMPTTLYIDAETKHEREKTGGDVSLREFYRKQLFRRLDLPEPINVDKVTATMDQGILQIIAPKAAGAGKVQSIAAA